MTRRKRISIVEINFVVGVVRDSEGEEYPITNYFDEVGAECGKDEAVALVAGKESTWFTLDIENYEPVALH